MWRKFGAFVRNVHTHFKFGFKPPNYTVVVHNRDHPGNLQNTLM